MKNKVNKQIIKALSVGIAASMALQPVAVYAETTEEPKESNVEKKEETTFVEADKAVENAEQKVVDAEKATGIEFDNSLDEMASATGDIETVKDNLTTAESYVELAGENDKTANQDITAAETILDVKDNDGKNIYDEHISSAEQGFQDATSAAEESKELSEKVTKDTSRAEAEKLVNAANEKYEEAVDAYGEAVVEYNAAKSTYEAAKAKLDEAENAAGATADEIALAKQELAQAKASLDMWAETVNNAKLTQDAALEEVLGDDYQKIQDAKDDLAAGKITKEDYAKLLIASYIKANGGSISDKAEDEEGFSTKTEYYVTSLDENGNKQKTGEKNYKAVTYKNSDKVVVTDYYEVYQAEDGTVSVKKLTVEEVDDLDKLLKEAVAHQDAIPDKWQTKDGTKTFEETQTTHTVNIDDTDESKGFYAIDTQTSAKTVLASDDVSTKTQGNKTTTYTAVGEQSAPVYTNGSEVIIDGYEKKTGPQNAQYSSLVDAENAIKDLVEQGYNVQVKYKHLVSQREEVIDINKMTPWTQIKVFVKGIVGIDSLSVSTTNEIDDKDNPITHTEAGIIETVYQNYTETITTVDEKEGNEHYYGFGILTDSYMEAYKKALSDYNTLVAQYTAAGWTVDTQNSKVYQDGNMFYAYVRAAKATDSTETVRKAVSRVRYEADTYSKFVKGQDEVPASAAVYGTKLNDTVGASLVQADLQDKLDTQKTKKEFYEQLVRDAISAQAAYNEAVKAVEAAQKKVNELSERKVTGINYAVALADLNSAKAKLEEAEGKKTAADEALLNAGEALDNAKEELAKKPVPSSGSDDDDQPGSGDNTTSDDTTDVAPVARQTTPLVADNQAVLGEVRRTATRSSKKAVSTSEAVSTDSGNSNNSEVAGAKKEETKTPVVEETKEIEETETALAATPELEEKGFAWWWLLILAAIAGVSVEEYARRKKNKAKAENSTKVTK